MRWLILITVFLFPFSCLAETRSEIDRFLESREVVEQVFFQKRQITLSTEARTKLDSLVTELLNYQNQGKLVRVEGFSSPEGDEKLNLSLSLQRAMTVKDYLHGQHDISVDVFLTGYGEKKLSGGKLSQERRVDITVYNKNSAAAALFDESGAIERYDLQ